MPVTYIDVFSEITPDAVTFDLSLDFEADGELAIGGRARFDLGLAFEAVGVVQRSTNADFDLGLDFYANAFYDGVEFVYADAEFDLGLEFEATAKTIQSSLALFDLGLDFEALDEVRESEIFPFSLIVDVLPETNPRRTRVKLLVDGNELPIESYSLSRGENQSVSELQISLADINDHTAIGQYSSVQFQIGQWIDGAWDWETVFDVGQVENSQYTFNRNGDSFSFNSRPESFTRLSMTPQSDVVIYDSRRQILSSSDYEPIPDSDGNLYHTELVPVPNLKLYDLFNRIFITRLGYMEWESNIPNFPINQAPFAAGEAYVIGLKQILGLFEVDFDEVGGKVWIRDNTVEYPPGFPEPLEITLSDLTELRVETQYNRLDAYKLMYSADRRNHDMVVDRDEETVAEVGDWGEEGYQKTTTTRTIREYKNSERPFIVADSHVVEVHQETTVGIGIYTINESTEKFTYDPFGNPTKRKKTVLKQLPNLPASPSLILREAANEVEEWEYAPHPFQAGGKYMSRHTLIESALTTIDSENQQLGQDYERAMVDVFRAGNVLETMSTALKPVRIRSETYKPLRDGRCRLDLLEIDVLAKQVVNSDSQIVSGDIAMNGLVKEQRPMFIWDEENITRTTQRVETINGGEVPVNILIPLAKRRLRNLKTRPRRISGGLPGHDRRLRVGLPIKPRVRGGESLGIFVIEGLVASGDRNGHQMQITCRQG